MNSLLVFDFKKNCMERGLIFKCNGNIEGENKITIVLYFKMVQPKCIVNNQPPPKKNSKK